MPGKYFEQFELRQTFKHSVVRTVTEADNVLFCAITHNPQPLHLNEDYARKTEFGQRLVNSLYTVALGCGVSVEDTTLGTLVANLGFAEWRFPAPVFHGDTLRTETEIVAKRDSGSRPDAGIVTFEHRMYNQHEKLVASFQRIALMQRLPS